MPGRSGACWRNSPVRSPAARRSCAARPATPPVLAVDLFRRPLFALSAATSVCSFAAQGLAFVSLPFLFQHALGRSQVETGFLMTPWPVVVALMAPIAGRLSDRYPPGLLGGIGLAILAAGMASLAALPAEPSVVGIAWRMALCGAGFGFFQGAEPARHHDERAAIPRRRRERHRGDRGASSARPPGRPLVAACFAGRGGARPGPGRSGSAPPSRASPAWSAWRGLPCGRDRGRGDRPTARVRPSCRWTGWTGLTPAPVGAARARIPSRARPGPHRLGGTRRDADAPNDHAGSRGRPAARPLPFRRARAGTDALRLSIGLADASRTTRPPPASSRRSTRSAGTATAGSTSRSYPTASSAASRACSRSCARARSPFTLSSASSLQTLAPLAGIPGVAYAFPGYVPLWAALDGGPLSERIRDSLGKFGLKAFRLVDNGFRDVITSVRPIETVADLHGLKIRVPPSPLLTALFRALGAAPTTINLAENYAALQTRVAERDGELAAADRGDAGLRGPKVSLAHRPLLGRVVDPRPWPDLGRLPADARD